MTDTIDLRKDVQIEDNFQNRGLDTQQEELSDINVGLLDIDSAIIKYLNDVVQPTVEQDGKKVKVPVLYANPPRWKNIRHDGVLRDKVSKIAQIPLIVLRRTSISKNYLNNPINRYLEKEFYSTRWNSRNKYDRFAIQNNITPSQRYVSVIYPDYYDVEYECIIWTDYQIQMNSIIEQISFEVENYWGEDNKFKFKTSVEEYTNSVELPENEDRVVRSEFVMNVKAYLIPESHIDKHGRPATTNKVRFTNKKVVVRESFVNGFVDRRFIPSDLQESLNPELVIISGDGQSASANYNLSSQIVVEVRFGGSPVAAGTVVGVTGSVGDGTVYPATP